MLNGLETFIPAAATWLWGPPMLIILSVIGIVFTIRLKGLQFSHIFKAGKLTYTQRAGSGEGNITPLQSLFSALGGQIGNANIAGTAILPGWQPVGPLNFQSIVESNCPPL